MKKLLVTLAVLASTGCSGPVQFVVHDDVRGVVPKAPRDKALVVFARPSPPGRGFNTRLYDGDELVGLLTGRSYFVYETTPGKHLFASLGHDIAKYTNFSFLEADLAPGKTYFVWASWYPRYKGLGLQQWVDLNPVKPGTDEWQKMQTWLPENCGRLEVLPVAEQFERENAEYFGEVRKEFFAEWSAQPHPVRIEPGDGI